MGMLSLSLIIVFIAVCVLLVLLVSVQDEKQTGLAGIFGGRGGSTFGSETASVIVKITSVLATLFFALALVLSVLNKNNNNISDSMLDRVAAEEIEQSITEENPIASDAENTDSSDSTLSDQEEATTEGIN